MTKSKRAGVQFRAYMELFAPNLAEDQVQFFGFLPEIAGLGFQAGFCGGHHQLDAVAVNFQHFLPVDRRDVVANHGRRGGGVFLKP